MTQTFRHILVPTDFGDAAKRAEEVAIDIARRFDAKLTLLYACYLPPLPYGSVFAVPLDAMLEMARKDMDLEVEKAQQVYPQLTGVVRAGSATHTIVSAVSELGADLIVMGTQGRRGPARLVLGSVAENVLRLAPVPVLTVSAKVEQNAA